MQVTNLPMAPGSQYEGLGEIFRQQQAERDKARASELSIMLQEEEAKQAEAKSVRDRMINRMLEETIRKAEGRSTIYRADNSFSHFPEVYTPEQREKMTVFLKGRPADVETLELLKRQQLGLPVESPQELEARNLRYLSEQQKGTMDVQAEIAERAETAQTELEKRTTAADIAKEERARVAAIAAEKKGLIGKRDKEVAEVKSYYRGMEKSIKENARKLATGFTDPNSKRRKEIAASLELELAENNDSLRNDLAMVEAGHQAEMSAYGYAEPYQPQVQVPDPLKDVQRLLDSIFNPNQQKQLGITSDRVSQLATQYNIDPNEVLQTIYETYLVRGGQ